MAKTDNLNDFLKDIADAIREKKGTTDPINAQNFADEIKSGGGSTPSKPKWTGHADAEGLRAIGWTDEDIAYYQENGVNWNEEDDEYHKVSEDNKALYGVLTADNISTYRDRIVYLPKIDTSGMTSMSNMFHSCYSLVSIPPLNTSRVTEIYNMFYGCYSLVNIPMLDLGEVTDTFMMFRNCHSLVNIPPLNISKVTRTEGMFHSCYSLVSIPQLDTSNVTNMNSMFSNCYSLLSLPQLDTSNVTSMETMFYYCYSLVSIPQLDISKVSNMLSMFSNCYSLLSLPQLDTRNAMRGSSMFNNCYSLTHPDLKNVHLDYQLKSSALLSKESLLYIINNETARSAITITLASYAYTRLANDADIVAALANHPNISIAQ